MGTETPCGETLRPMATPKTPVATLSQQAERDVPSEEALACFGRAFAHPIRIRIVLALANSRESSPRDLARTLGASLSNVSYHVRYLAELGAIELRRVLPRRGALMHVYGLAPAVQLMVPLAQQIGTSRGLPTS